MELSIIIVSYNVKYFLEQCLYSVKKAVESLESGAGATEETRKRAGTDGLQRSRDHEVAM